MPRQETSEAFDSRWGVWCYWIEDHYEEMSFSPRKEASGLQKCFVDKQVIQWCFHSLFCISWIGRQFVHDVCMNGLMNGLCAQRTVVNVCEGPTPLTRQIFYHLTRRPLALDCLRWKPSLWLIVGLLCKSQICRCDSISYRRVITGTKNQLMCLLWHHIHPYTS